MSKDIFDFMEDKRDYEFYNGKWKLHNNSLELILILENGSRYIIDDESDIQDILERELNQEIRFCDVCGCPMDTGFTDDDADFYNCEDCFPKDMDERYGKDKWREYSSEDGDCNSLGGFYEYMNEDGEWEPEPSYYTEWF